MAITLADFNKIWASTSPLTPYSFSEANYKQGWNFIGSTPPARQMWDFLQKNNDEKMQYLANNYAPLASPSFSGNPTAPTQATNDNSTRIANTEFVNNELKANTMLLADTFATIIPEGDDLNDYKTAGTYRTTGASVTNSLVNCPTTDFAIKLVVQYIGYSSSGYCMQRIYTGRQRIFVRSIYDSTTWTEWKQVAYAEDVLPLSGGTMTGAITRNSVAIKGSVNTSYVEIEGGTSDQDGAYLTLYGGNRSSYAGRFVLSAKQDANTKKSFVGDPDGTLTWDGQPIQTSSDKRLKQDFSNVPADVLEAWGKVEWKQFKYKADVERKGENCRFHTGLVAQDVKEVGEDNNVDLLRYGILCHDVRSATAEQEAVDLWTVRYEEALAMEAIYQRRRADRLEERIEALEKLLMNRTE